MCVCVYIYIYIYTHTHKYIYTYVIFYSFIRIFQQPAAKNKTVYFHFGNYIIYSTVYLSINCSCILLCTLELKYNAKCTGHRKVNI